jgi:hypothetical protein
MQTQTAAPDPRHATAPWLATVALLASLGGPLPTLAANGDALKPFSTSYAVMWKGMKVGTSSLRLTEDAAGRYTYVSHNQARGIFRLAFPGDILQQSQFQLVGGLVRPLQFRGDDGTSDTARDVSLDFDWDANRARGTAEQRPVDLALRPGLQDPMSVQIALMLELAAARTPEVFWMLDKDEIKEYVYAREGNARLDTPVGALDTVVYASHRPNSDRITRIWYAQSLGWVPVRAERTRAGKLEWSMLLQKVQRSP